MDINVKIFEALISKPILDVIMLTYQHSKYVRQAIESVLMQETEYQYRLIICDDCSCDGTQEILQEYYDKYPDRIMLFLAETNSNGLYFEQIFTYLKHTEYVAWLEGDDYWTDKKKIQKQISFLEKHEEFIGVAGNVRNVNEDGQKQHRDFDLYEFQCEHIYTKHNAMKLEQIAHISTITYRSFYSNWSLEEWHHYCCSGVNGDRILSVLLGLEGDVFYSADIYGDHRRVFQGTSWTAQNEGKNTILTSWKQTRNLKRYIIKQKGINISIDGGLRYHYMLSIETFIQSVNIYNLYVVLCMWKEMICCTT